MTLILESKRLALRVPTAEDAAFFFELLNDPDWIRNVGDRGIKDLADARGYIKSKLLKQYAEHGFCLYLVSLKATRDSIGICGLVKRGELEEVDLGFAFLPAFRQKGYALESSQAVMTYARDTLGIGRLQAITLPSNKPSILLLEKLGMIYEKTVLWPDGDELAVYGVELEKHRDE